jgi:transketolase
MPNSPAQDRLANAIRFLAIDAVQKANSGHPGMPMGMADVATVLFTKFLRIDPLAPAWPNRDRFVLSAGHGSMLLYATQYLMGYPEMTIEQIENFRQLHSKTPGHPEYGHTPGVEATTGPLGQGLAMSIGMAIAEAALAARYGADLVDHHTYVICGDGCLMEGVSHEAIDLAGHLKLHKLIVMWDDNRISIDGATSLATSCDQIKRFEAHGWRTLHVDGHDQQAIEAALKDAQTSDRPVFIACRTTIGFGAPHLAGSEKTHGSPLGTDEVAGTRKALGWDSPPFVIPDDLLSAWRKAGERSRETRAAWEAKAKAHPKWAEFSREVAGDLPGDFQGKMADYKRGLIESKPNVATRKSSEMALGIINSAVPAMLGGSADLTHSNLTLTKGQESLRPQEYGGSYIRYGIREFGMSAAMNGIALHGGFIPYGGTFLVFSDYARGAIRLSALMGIRVVYVLTHDSIGLGEDGPTHQPVEHLAALRAIPNLNVMRPADAVECAECWELALGHKQTPTILSLSRQNLPTLRTSSDVNLSARGAYVLSEPEGGRELTLLATGSEVALAVTAANKLKEKGRRIAVVSMPCWEIFEQQDAGYRASVLGSAPRIAVEAALGFGWERYTGDRGKFLGMHGFGASAPGTKTYEAFGITDAALVKLAEETLGS